MPVDVVKCMKVAEILAKEEGIQVAVTLSAAGAAFTAATTFVGGILGGPLGLAVGGILGGVSSGAYSQGRFKSAVEVIRDEMTDKQKRQLATHIDEVLGGLTYMDALDLAMFILGQQSMKLVVIKLITDYLINNLGYSIKTNERPIMRCE